MTDDLVKKATKEVIRWAQATLTALNVGGVQSESPIHLKLRDVMIKYREAVAALEAEDDRPPQTDPPAD